jgi:hypothetical protein
MKDAVFAAKYWRHPFIPKALDIAVSVHDTVVLAMRKR